MNNINTQEYTKVVIQGRLAGLNELIAAINHNKYAGNKIKRDNTLICKHAFIQQCNKKFDKINLMIVWYEKDKKRDPDNIISGKKYLLDGMVEAGIISGDGWKQMNHIEELWKIDKNNPRIEVYIYEIT